MQVSSSSRARVYLRSALQQIRENEGGTNRYQKDGRSESGTCRKDYCLTGISKAWGNDLTRVSSEKYVVLMSFAINVQSMQMYIGGIGAVKRVGFSGRNRLGQLVYQTQLKCITRRYNQSGTYNTISSGYSPSRTEGSKLLEVSEKVRKAPNGQVKLETKNPGWQSHTKDKPDSLFNSFALKLRENEICKKTTFHCRWIRTLLKHTSITGRHTWDWAIIASCVEFEVGSLPRRRYNGEGDFQHAFVWAIHHWLYKTLAVAQGSKQE